MKQTMTSRLLLALAITGTSWVACAAIARPELFNIKSDGAIGDGVAIETAALQKAIDACHVAGGGVIWMPAGGS